jgi:uncharacterized protein YkwD
LVALALLSCSATAAQATTTLSATPDIPVPNGPVTAGQTGVPGTLTVENASTGAQATLPMTLSAITIVPSCGTVAFVDCPVASVDPGVFQPSSTGTGEAGTGCAGVVFAITNVDAVQDKYQLIPQTTVVLGDATAGGGAARCVVDFTVTVLGVPTIDAGPQPGLQTEAIGGATGMTSDSASGSGANATTVDKATPTLTTSASPASIGLGQSFGDTATIGGIAGAGGSTVTFTLYGPDDTTCAGPVVSTSMIPYPAGGGPVASSAFTPTAAGTYRWVASYGGDASDNAVSGACNDAGESVVVSKATPTVATTASAPIGLGAGTLSDSAVVAGRVAPAAGATVTFTLYGPDDAACAGVPAFPSTPVAYPVAGGSVASPAFTPTQAGTYRWVAAYSGDANDNAASGSCNDAGESTAVAKVTPSIATTASAPITLGSGTLSDSATVTGRAAPAAGATVIFSLFGPGDATCTGAPVTTSTAPYPVGGGPVTATAFTPTAAGTYRWVASYSGDANNNTASGTCNDANESTVVAVPIASPTIATTASADTALGAGTLTDSATVSGRGTPLAGATVVFSLYGPDDATCSGPLAATSTVLYPVAGGPVTAMPFTPMAAGTYRWIASYSGDANDHPASGACNDAGESTVVAKATPSIATTASAGLALGAGTLTDSATLTGISNPVGGATVTFRLFGPSDAACAGAVVSTSTVAYPVGAGSATSSAFTPMAAGTYRWVASYSGDANNNAVSGACNDVGESTVVAKATPVIATTASAPVTLGSGTLTDGATVTGRVNPPAITTVTFSIYGPDDATCTGPVVSTSMIPYPAGGGPVTSSAFTPTAAGTYRWIASYGGDANDNAVSGACNDVGESTVVAKANPTIATTASADIMLGAGTLTDSATVSGRVSPAAAATVTFNAYGPNDATCTGPVAFTSTAPYTSAGGPVTSSAFTPTAAGTYRWVASYGGDANNAAAVSPCNAVGESATVAKANPTIASTASASTTLGAGTLTDSATVSGRVSPLGGATVTFKLYGPNDTTCTGTVATTSTVAYPTGGAATPSGAFTPTQAGTYRWIAAYSGDANNTAVASPCNAPSEATFVAKVTPAIATTASAPTTLGSGTLTDAATVTGRSNPGSGATITFNLYGPGDATCAGPVVSTSTVAYPMGGGSVTSSAFAPQAAGTYRWVASYSGDANDNTVAGTCGDASETTLVNRVTPAIATTASANVALGPGTLTDSATVSARNAPLGGATVTFTLYGPNDATCAGPVLTTSTVPYPMAGGAVTSAAFTPTQTGTYRWIASYGGDANNNAVSAACNAANESTVVTAASPAIATTASASIALGAGQLTDSATVTGRTSPLAGATITFKLYGPNDQTCALAPAFTSPAVAYPPTGGAVTSASFTPAQAGAYRWVATYGGDANNAAVTGACNAPNESTVVQKATPTIATTASAGVALGAGQLTDSATVSGRTTPVAGASITFKLYGPDDATCSASPAFTSVAVSYPATGGPVLSSPAFTPAQAGTYRWIASYSGDANNAATAGACGDAGESTVVTKAAPTIATTASPGIALGAGTLTDSATVSGRTSPVAGATVTFTLYGPDDATCTGTVASTSTVPYPAPAGGPVTSAAFTPSQIGTYRWTAAYGGDANNLAATSACNAASESTAVTTATPAVATTASPNVVLGAGQLTDSATVTGRTSPGAGASILFDLYGPDDATCSGAVISTSTVPYPATGGPVTSAPFTPASVGTYRWTASYSGDANNAAIAGACNAAGESTVVATAAPTIASTASPNVALGAGTLTDTATVSGRSSPLAGATVVFRLYGPDDASCANTPAFTSPAVAYPVTGGAVTSPAFTPAQTGTYRWRASYGGDANNLAVTGACSAAGESVVVGRATPTIAATASPGVALGAGALSDSATIDGLVSPVAGATLQFALYADGDTACAAAPVFTSAATVSATGTAASAAFTPTAAGTYRWVATYGGDANDAPVASACADARQSVVVAPAAVTPLPPPAPQPPVVVSAGFGGAPVRVGHTVVLTVNARSTSVPVVGLKVQFGEGAGLVGSSACQLQTQTGSPGLVHLRLPFAFRHSGAHRVKIAVLAGSCSGPLLTTATRTVSVTVKAGTPKHKLPGAKVNGCADAALPPTAATRTRVDAAVLCLVNVQRHRNGRSKLVRSALLASAASGHSADMVRRRYWDHNTKGGATFAQRLPKLGYKGATRAENMDYSSQETAAAAVSDWMASPPHRANILQPKLKFVGIGVAVGIPAYPSRPGATFTMDFGSSLR